MDLPLWEKASLLYNKALASGAIHPLHTRIETVSEPPLTFYLRQLSSLKLKPGALEQSDVIKSQNPFLPHDPELYLGCSGPKHKLLLNKYNVLNSHLLLVTQAFEPQTDLLNEHDFRALHWNMAQGPALAFYNSGEVAGASQIHKHIQLVKLSENQGLLPFKHELAQLHDEVPRQIPELPFAHAALGLPKTLFDSSLNNAEDSVIILESLYNRLRMTLGIESQDSSIAQPYNLLMTDEWMIIVPRRKEHFEGISLNALAFVGALLVKDEEQALHLKNAGLTQALKEVSGLI